MILTELQPNYLRPMTSIWCCPTCEGMIEWFGDYSDAFLDAQSYGKLDQLDFTPIILLSCSLQKSTDEQREHHSWAYIQGTTREEEIVSLAADDMAAFACLNAK